MIPVSRDQRTKYLHRRILEVARLQGLDGVDLVSAASVVSHQLKGNCATFGMSSLLPVTSLLEEGARANDLGKIRDALIRMEQLVLAEIAVISK